MVKDWTGDLLLSYYYLQITISMNLKAIIIFTLQSVILILFIYLDNHVRATFVETLRLTFHYENQ